MSKTNSSIN